MFYSKLENSKQIVDNESSQQNYQFKFPHSIKLKTMAEPKIIKDKEKLKKLAPVAEANLKHHVFVCGGKSCAAVGAAEVKEEFVRQLENGNLRYGKQSKGRNPNGTILLTDCGSVGFCSIGTAVLVYPENVWYAQVRESDVSEIIEKHLIGGEVVERLALVNKSE